MDAASLIEKLFPRGSGGGNAGDTWVVVALGNPGPEYRDTRHNVGWWTLDELTGRTGSKLKKTGADAESATVDLRGRPTVLVRPMTYVNLSGKAVRAALRKHNVPVERLIVVSDDLNLEPGRIRIRKKGGAGGHNGLKSVIDSLGTEEFARVRIGVGRGFDSGEQVDYVLGRMPPKEREAVRAAAVRAADAVEVTVLEGVDEAMNRFNG